MVVEGNGSYGIVLSSPRIPLENENYDDIINLDEVSKILFVCYKNNYYPAKFDEIKLAYDNVILLIKQYPNVFDCNNFLLPIKGGYIDKSKFVEYYNDDELNYGIEWLSNSSKNLNILNQLISHKDKIFQIVYEKGNKLNYNFDDFVIKISDVLQTLIHCKNNGFYLDDIKYLNLIVHNERIKIIDFEEPINLNLETNDYIQMISESKLNCISYFPYDTISNILLFEYIGKIIKIGKFTNGNYRKLILENSYEYHKNVIYKIKVFNEFISLWNKYLPDYVVDLEVIDISESENDFNKKNIQLNSKIFDKSIKFLYEKYFTNVNNEINKSDIINKIFYLNKKFIDLTQNNLHNKISCLLTNTNICSFGFIFIDWLKINISKIIKSVNVKKILRKIIKIISNCCLNNIIVDDEIYLIDKNYFNISKILNE